MLADIRSIETRLLNLLRLVGQGDTGAVRSTADMLNTEVRREHHPLLGVITGLLNSPHTDLRISAAVTLERFGPHAAPAVPRLISLLNETEDIWVASAAASALGSLPSRASATALARMLTSDLLPQIATHVFSGLARCGAVARHELQALDGFIGREKDTFLVNQAKDTARTIRHAARLAQTGEQASLALGSFPSIVPLLTSWQSEDSPPEQALRSLPQGQGVILQERFRTTTGLEFGECGLTIIRNPALGLLVLFIADDQSSGMPIRNRVEHLAAAVRSIFQIEHERITWIEHHDRSYGEIPSDPSRIVRIDFDSRSGLPDDPRWTAIPAQTLEILRAHGINV